MEFDTFIQHTKIANKICAKRGERERERSGVNEDSNYNTDTGSVLA